MNEPAQLHPDLDLSGRIRPGLDILAHEIVIGLKKRTRFASNPSLYKPGLVRSSPDQSLLHYELGRIEACHAELGRYDFAVQDAFTDVADIQPIIKRPVPDSPVQRLASGMGERIIGFYCDWVNAICTSGDRADTFGETVTADVTTLLSIMERVSLGKSVAEAKFVELTEDFMRTDGERETMLALIVRKERESAVIDMARQLARRYEMAEDPVVSAFEFMIQITVDIELIYLRKRIDARRTDPTDSA